MKQLTLISALLFMGMLWPTTGFAQKPDDILGTWQSQKEVTRTTFEKAEDGTYQARIVWIPEKDYENGQPPKDRKNPDKSLRERSLLGIVYIKDIRWNGKGWTTTHIYHPRMGLVAKGEITLHPDGMLEVVGRKMGISKNEEYLRVKE